MMMRNLFGIALMLVSLAGCGLKATVITPLNPQEVLDGQALTVMLSRVEASETVAPDDADEDKKPIKCLCGGTGRSGDGLGPCACPDGCSCKVKRAETETPSTVTEPEAKPAAADAKPTVEDAKPTVEDAKPTTAETPAVKEEQDIAGLIQMLDEKTAGQVEKVAQQLGRLADNQSEIADTLVSHEDRIKALEAKTAVKAEHQAPETSNAEPVIKPTGFTEQQAASRRPSVQLVCVCTLFCEPCKEQKQRLNSLPASGWRIGDEQDSHIIMVMQGEPTQSEMIRQAQSIAGQQGYPTLCFFRDGVFAKAIAGLTTANEVADMMNAIMTGKASTSVMAPATVTTIRTLVPRYERLPVVRTRWGTIDLQTYHRNCNCAMCNGIRALQAEYSQQTVEMVTTAAVAAAQAPTPGPTIDQMLNALQLSSSDVLADLGCGDARILIAACQRFGCSAVGVEIDATKADEARRAVEAAGLSSRVEIVTGDARQFDPAKYGVTAVTAYLYPDLLRELQPMLASVPVVVTPFHAVPGMQMQQRGDVWVRDQRTVVIPATARRTVPSFVLSV